MVRIIITLLENLVDLFKSLTESRNSRIAWLSGDAGEIDAIFYFSIIS